MKTPEPRTDPPSQPTFCSDALTTEDPLCGTTTTPKCPDPLVYEERDLLISRLSGHHPTPEQLRAAAERVDRYLSGVLRSGLVLAGCSIPEEARALYELRSELIYQLAGTRTDLEHIREATEQVDDYLLGELQSALQLTRSMVGRSHHGPARLRVR